MPEKKCEECGREFEVPPEDMDEVALCPQCEHLEEEETEAEDSTPEEGDEGMRDPDEGDR